MVGFGDEMASCPRRPSLWSASHKMMPWRDAVRRSLEYSNPSPSVAKGMAGTSTARGEGFCGAGCAKLRKVLVV
jgi:hypothetical protein